MAKQGRKRQVYRARVSGDGRTVTAPDGTVSIVGPARDGIQITGVLNEPFASLLAEPFNPERFIKAVVTMDPVQRERIQMLHERLHPKPEAKTQRARKRSRPTEQRPPRPLSALDNELVDRLHAKQAKTLRTAKPQPETPAEPKSLVDVGRIAQFLAVPKSWVYEQAKLHGLPHYRVGRYLRFDREEVKRWLDSRRG